MLLRGKWTEIAQFFANSRFKMLLLAIGQPHCLKGIGEPLVNSQRLMNSLWAILKRYQKDAGKCLINAYTSSAAHVPLG
jgi:hypothetical protein